MTKAFDFLALVVLFANLLKAVIRIAGDGERVKRQALAHIEKLHAGGRDDDIARRLAELVFALITGWTFWRIWTLL